MKNESKKMKPGQLATVNQKVYRVTKNIHKSHPVFGVIFETLSPCIKCLSVLDDSAVCDFCTKHIPDNCYMKPIRPKKTKG